MPDSGKESDGPELVARMEGEAQGFKLAWLRILRLACQELGAECSEAANARWIIQRSDTVSCLRELCRDYGDNDWPDNLYLVDVIEKHLEPYLIQESERAQP